MKTTVVHCKREHFDVYIGRPAAHENKGNEHFGNPFTHKSGTSALIKVSSRERAVEAFESWLKGEDYVNLAQEQRKYILFKLLWLKGKRLGCWCHPQSCHGDVLARMAEEAT